jgi:hypothetical protein
MTDMIRARMVCAMRLNGHDYMTDMTNIQAAPLRQMLHRNKPAAFGLQPVF